MPSTPRAELLLEARTLLDFAAAERRDLSDAERVRFEGIMTQLEGRPGTPETAAVLAEITAEARAVAAAATGLGEPRSADPLRDLYAAGETAAAYPWRTTAAETRSIANFSDHAALYTDDFAARVAVYARTFSPWLGLATVIPAADGRPADQPQLTADPLVYTPGEGTAITESSPTLAAVTVTPIAYKVMSYVSNEALEDAEYNITDVVTASASRAIGLAVGSAFTAAILGGITNGGTATGVGGDGTAVVPFFGYEDLIDLKYSAAAPYRESGTWVMSNGAIRKVRKFRDASRQYYWQPAVASGQPPAFDGSGVFEDPYLAAPASATRSVVFGDARAGLVVKATPMRVFLSEHYRAANDQLTIRVTGRLGLAVADPAALRYLVSANS